MPLPVPNLDDLRFQRDLVDEARRRIIRYCPEWTDYNLSDPGITLIELFAWMTEMLVYRLNRVPERNYLKFLEMMGFQLLPASSARAALTFYLSTAFPISPESDTIAVVPQGLEVTTRSTEEEAEVTFTTDERLVIAPPRLVQLRREVVLNRNYLSRLGIETFYAFDRQSPQAGDTFYLGFDEDQDIGGYILRLTFECEGTQAVGVRREDPPWVWECSIGDGEWQEVPPSSRRGERDTTGGLNNPSGFLTLYLPLSMRPDQVHGREAYWVRCRLEPRREEQGMYKESPRVRSIQAHVLGGTTWVTHAQIVRDEHLGFSDGEPGQVTSLQNAPVLALRAGETVEVEERKGAEIVYWPWERVEDFSQSTRYDRHFILDEATGEIRFGPAVRQPDGSVRQYGRVPEAARRIRITDYRHGGGVAGNVPTGRIETLRSAVPYVDRATNLARAEGGRDQESLEELQMRARRELRAQQRAVTAEDFEDLSKGASRSIARVRCSTTGKGARALPPGMVALLVVPAAFDALRAGDLTKLHLEEALLEEIRAHLDQYRLLTTTLRIREPSYLGVRADVEIVVSEFSQPDLVRARAKEKLQNLLSPLAIGPASQNGEGPFGTGWEGWPFGRDLFVSEVYSLLQQVPGVKHVLDVRLDYRPVVPYHEGHLYEELEVEESGSTTEEEVADHGSDPLLHPVEGRMLEVPPDTLLCSLDHRIEVVEL
jgi:predicted phage baseplate assembly protein